MHGPENTDHNSSKGMWPKHLKAAILVAVAWAIASLGRFVLDWGIQEWPAHTAVIERVGGWLLGLVVVIFVVLPMFKLYGLFSSPARRDRQ